MIEEVFKLISTNKVKSFIAFWIVSPVITFIILLTVFGLFPVLENKIQAEVNIKLSPIEEKMRVINENVIIIKQSQNDIYNHLIGVKNDRARKKESL